MKYILLLVLVVTLFPCVVGATVIGVYTSAYNGDCLLPPHMGPVTLYVVQQLSLGSTSVRFRVETSPGFPAALVSWSVPNGTAVGNPFTGITVNYGTCLSSTITVLELHYLFTGAEANCSYVRTAADPSSPDGLLDSYDCVGARVPADWRGTHIQSIFPDEGGYPFTLCPDLLGAGHTGYGCKPVDEPLPVAASTWGAVKALYR